jgi:hypothetical protein
VSRPIAEIRSSIETNRNQLGVSIEQLRGEVTRMTDWRAHYRRHERPLLIGAAVTGFVIAGGVAALIGRRKRG